MGHSFVFMASVLVLPRREVFAFGVLPQDLLRLHEISVVDDIALKFKQKNANILRYSDLLCLYLSIL